MTTSRPSRAGLIRHAPAFVVLSLIAVTTLYPLLFVGFTAFKTEENYGTEPLGPPTDPTTEYVHQAWVDGHMGSYLVNSARVVIPAVLIIAAVSVLAGYALTQRRFRGSGLVFLTVVALMAVPPTVVMIPTFRTVQQLGLLNSYLGLTLVYAALFTPLSIYLIAAYLRRLPRAVLEAAAVDGASELKALLTIVVPLAWPAIATVMTLDFLWLWNELLFGLLILQDPEKRVTTVGLASLEGNLSTPVPLLAAGLLISLIPVVLVFLTSQRKLATGMTAGAVR